MVPMIKVLRGSWWLLLVYLLGFATLAATLH